MSYIFGCPIGLSAVKGLSIDFVWFQFAKLQNKCVKNVIMRVFLLKKMCDGDDLHHFGAEKRKKCRRNLVVWDKRTNFAPLFGNRALSSAGLEHLPYKQGVGGSNPSAPTFHQEPTGVCRWVATLLSCLCFCVVVRANGGTERETFVKKCKLPRLRESK